jgi:predicted N-acetyltransferase YhbS
MEIRPIRTEECPELGALTVRCYQHLLGGHSLGGYEHELADVASRLAECEVFVALDDGGTLVGGITYVPGPGTSMSEFSDPHAAGMRHLAVDPSRQGAGAGHALVVACIDRARTQRRQRLTLHSTPPMVVARAMYERFGFQRAPESDVIYEGEPYSNEEPLHLMAYALELEPNT